MSENVHVTIPVAEKLDSPKSGRKSSNFDFVRKIKQVKLDETSTFLLSLEIAKVIFQSGL
jgi:hypothetical protein